MVTNRWSLCTITALLLFDIVTSCIMIKKRYTGGFCHDSSVSALIHYFPLRVLQAVGTTKQRRLTCTLTAQLNEITGLISHPTRRLVHDPDQVYIIQAFKKWGRNHQKMLFITRAQFYHHWHAAALIQRPWDQVCHTVTACSTTTFKHGQDEAECQGGSSCRCVCWGSRRGAQCSECPGVRGAETNTALVCTTSALHELQARSSVSQTHSAHCFQLPLCNLLFSQVTGALNRFTPV